MDKNTNNPSPPRVQLTTSGLLKAFGGALETQPRHFVVKFDGQSFKINDTSDHQVQTAFENEMSRRLGTQVTSKHLLCPTPGGLKFPELISWLTQTPQSQNVETVDLDKLEMLVEAGNTLPNIRVETREIRPRDKPFLAQHGFKLNGEFYVNFEEPDFQQAVDLAVRAEAFLRKSITSSPEPKIKATPNDLEKSGLAFVNALYYAPETTLREAAYKAPLDQVSVGARSKLWSKLTSLLGEWVKYDDILSFIQSEGYSQAFADRFIVSRKGQLEKDGESFRLRSIR